MPEEPGIAHEPMEEARIEEVQDGVLDPADVLVDREPVIDPCIEHMPALVGRAVAGVIPGRLEEGVEGVGLTLRLAAAGRAARLIELRHALEGRGHALEGHVLRQYHRQLGLRHRHRPAGGAVDDRDRTAPVALAGDPPVPEPVVDLAAAPAVAFEVRRDGVEGRLRVQTVEGPGVPEHAGLGVGAVPELV